MKLTDIIALAKNGYSPQDIKDLVALADPAEPETKAEDQQEQENSDKSDKTDSDNADDTIDYKSLYEESQKKLEAAQAANRKSGDHIEEKSQEEIAIDFVNKLLK